jgi:KaiC/GvpD/RAD55 family RecA-like ATPase
VLVRRYILSNLAKKIPVVVVLTDGSASDLRKQLAGLDSKYASYEKADLIRFVDTYSRSIGVAENHATIEYVDGLINFNAVSLAINNAERNFVRQHAQHALVLDSVSTLIAYTNAATAFRYLQVLLGKTKAAGASALLTLSQGMHPESEVQMVKHLVDGIIELKNDQGKLLLHVDGIGSADSRGWVEYRADDGAFEVTGSFSAGRIR